MSTIDPWKLRPGQRFRRTEVIEGRVERNILGDRLLVVTIDGAEWRLDHSPIGEVTWEVITEPLPTKPGSYIVATVTRGDVVRENVVLWLAEDGDDWVSFAGEAVDGRAWHKPEHLSDWRVFDPATVGIPQG